MNENHKFGHLHLGLPDDILRYKVNGDFDRGIKQIEYRVSQGDLSEEMVDALRAQSEIMRRLPEEYPFSQEEAMGLLQKHIPDFTLEELQERFLKGKLTGSISRVNHIISVDFLRVCIKQIPIFNHGLLPKIFPGEELIPIKTGNTFFRISKKK